MIHPLSENEFTPEERSVAYNKVCKKMDEQFHELIEEHEKLSKQQPSKQSTKKSHIKNLKSELESVLKKRKADVLAFFNEYDHKIVLIDDFIGSYDKEREDEYRNEILKIMHDANDSKSPLLILDPIVEQHFCEILRETNESNKQINNPICYANGRLIASPLFDY